MAPVFATGPLLGGDFPMQHVPVSMWLLVVTLHVSGMRGTLASILTLACSKVCSHGTCRYPSAGMKTAIRCDCHPGWGGDRCSLPCDKPCMHGQCVLLADRPVCVCRLGFAGHDCSLPGYDVNLLTLARLVPSAAPTLDVSNSNPFDVVIPGAGVSKTSGFVDSSYSAVGILNRYPVHIDTHNANSTKYNGDVTQTDISKPVFSNANFGVQNLASKNSSYISVSNPIHTDASQPNISNQNASDTYSNLGVSIPIYDVQIPSTSRQKHDSQHNTSGSEQTDMKGLQNNSASNISVSMPVVLSMTSDTGHEDTVQVGDKVASVTEPTGERRVVVKDGEQLATERLEAVATERRQLVTENRQVNSEPVTTDMTQVASDNRQLDGQFPAQRQAASSDNKQFAEDNEQWVTDTRHVATDLTNKSEQLAVERRVMPPESHQVQIPLEENPNVQMELNVESGASQCSANFLCLNGGHCVKGMFGGFRCQCLPHFTGTFCQSSCPKPCHNGGWCVKLRHPVSSTAVTGPRSRGLPRYRYTYGCNCPPSYGGEQCERLLENW